MVAGHTALKDVPLPAMDLWDVLFGQKKAYFHEDNSAMITVVETGRNPTMRHLHRVHRICIAWLHQMQGKGNGHIELISTASEDMKADMYTTQFSDTGTFDHSLELNNLLNKNQLAKRIK